MIRPAALLFLPLFLLVSCETTESSKPRHLSSTRGLQEETGRIGNKALVKQSDPKTLTKYRKVMIEDVKVVHTRTTNERVKPTSRAESEQLAERVELTAEAAEALDITLSKAELRHLAQEVKRHLLVVIEHGLFADPVEGGHGR